LLSHPPPESPAHLTIQQPASTQAAPHAARPFTHGSDPRHKIIGLAMRVHRRLGPGLLESVYELCLCHEIDRAAIPFRRQVALPVSYDEVLLDCGYVADIIVDNQVTLELKPAERILPLHEAQLLTYLRLSSCHVGLLINFNTVSLTEGIKRCVL
jgi:GxxExxY protein